MTLNEISNSSLTLLCSDVELTRPVETFGGVMGDNSALINIGDFVNYHDQTSAAQVNRKHDNIIVH